MLIQVDQPERAICSWLTSLTVSTFGIVNTFLDSECITYFGAMSQSLSMPLHCLVPCSNMKVWIDSSLSRWTSYYTIQFRLIMTDVYDINRLTAKRVTFMTENLLICSIYISFSFFVSKVSENASWVLICYGSNVLLNISTPTNSVQIHNLGPHHFSFKVFGKSVPACLNISNVLQNGKDVYIFIFLFLYLHILEIKICFQLFFWWLFISYCSWFHLCGWY